ncbi:fatty acid desaturase [Pinisolibacter sp.]|uniref:fatty acid desaturase n=1 Tax=Pinisolibacter sp. TaxID=2172024 RepID=UPI002FDDE380
MLSFFGKRSPHKALINGNSISVDADETLLQAALRQEVAFPNNCRVGGCGACKCKLKNGKVAELTETAYLLTEKEIADGYILACQSRLTSDIDIELDVDAAFSSDPVHARIVGREFLTHDIVRIDVQLDRPIAYKAGQYAEVTLAAVPGAPRCYSFSTAPNPDGHASFTIRRVPGGRFSTHVFDNDVIGHELTVRGPAGDFYLRDGAEKVLFVAGGSGLAPILGMLEEMDRNGDRRPVTLIFGARQRKDLYELDRLAAYAAKWPDFRFLPVLSDDDANTEWTGLRGLATDFIKEHAAGVAAAYLCGPPAMVDAAIEANKASGIAPDKIHADRFFVKKIENTGFYGAVGLPKVERSPATAWDYLKFMLLHLVGFGAIAAYLAGGVWIAVGLLGFIALYVGGDMIAGDDVVTPNYRKPWILTLQLWMALPMLSAISICFLWSLATGDPLGLGSLVQSVTGYDAIAARDATGPWTLYLWGTVYFGLLIGFVGTVTAHELTHRTWDPISLWIGRWLLAFSYDVGFAIEHVYGHHRYVSTEHDPATAPRGRNVYFHIVASTIKGNISAANIEADRLRRKHLPVFSLHNAYIRGLLMSAALVVVAFAMAGWTGVLFFSIGALWGKALLEIVNYMEHYGMVRLPNQAVEPRHSWNTNSTISSWGMFNLSRHSHHHAQGEVPYQDLMPLPSAPVMIGGYLATVIVTLIPPLWHRLMIPKLMQWDRDHASSEERILALRANQRSGLAALTDYDPRDWALTPAE